MKKTLIIIAVVIAVAAGAFFVIKNNAKKDAGSEFQTEEVESGNLTATVGATGTVRSNQSALLSWQTGGTVEHVEVNVSDRVSKDVVLASLENTSLAQNIILAEADLVNAEKALDDLLQSGTTAAQARVTLREADEALEKAQNYRDSLDDRSFNGIVKTGLLGLEESVPFKGTGSSSPSGARDFNLSAQNEYLFGVEPCLRQTLSSGFSTPAQNAYAELVTAR